MWTKILANLRVISMFYQTAHWSVQGRDFYQEHLLFERLYNQVAPEIDLVAEKSLYVNKGSKSLKYDLVLKEVVRLSKSIEPKKNKDYLKRGIKLEERFIKYLSDEVMKKELSEGAKDLIAEILNSHEQNIFLLRSQL